MSLKGFEQIKHIEYRWRKESKYPWKNYSKSRKYLKKLRNRWLRRFNKLETPPTRRRVGWEY